MAEKVINIKEIGLIKLNKNSRAKRLTIRIKPFVGVVVTVPSSVSYKYAEKFIHEKKSWIIKSLSKIDKIEEKQTVFIDNSVFTTRNHFIKFNSYEGRKINISEKGKDILIKYPNHINVRDENIQKVFRNIIIEIWRTEAKDYLPNRLNELALKHKFSYGDVKIRTAKS